MEKVKRQKEKMENVDQLRKKADENFLKLVHSILGKENDS